MFDYPIFLNLEGRSCLVVGGGKIATRKVRKLLDAKAEVHVIAPKATVIIERWQQQERLLWHKRTFQTSDIEGHFLVFATTNDSAINKEIEQSAKAHDTLCCNTDEAEGGSFILPAMAEMGPLKVALSTSGQSPALARKLRQHIERQVFTPELKLLVEWMGHWRPKIKSWLPTPQHRQLLWRRLLEAPVASWLSKGNIQQAESWLKAQIALLRRDKLQREPSPTATVGGSGSTSNLPQV